VPALAEQLDLLAPKIQFLSIGTNDLTQFLFAADRSNPKLAERYDWLSPAILRFLSRIVRTLEAQANPIDVTVCGEMGGRQLEAMALIGLGIERLSITPASVAPMKAMVGQLDVGAIREAMAGWLAAPPPDMRQALVDWAAARGLVFD
jgi:phosphotransferase system enzyme I (PtsP)